MDEKGQKSSWEGEQWILAQEKGEHEGSQNRDEKMVMVMLIVEKEKRKQK
jgi:hypothetical protein